MPFASTYTLPELLWLGALLIAWGVLLLGGFAFGHPTPRNPRRMPRWCRIASSTTLTIAAWSWCLIGRNSLAREFALFIAAGMTCGLVGDLFMAKLIPVKQRLSGGIVAFSLGHVAYVAAAWSLGTLVGFARPAVRIGWLAVMLAIGALDWYMFVFRDSRDLPGSRQLRWGGLPYLLLLSAFGGLAVGLAVQASFMIGLAIGSVLFLASDTLLVCRLVSRRHFRLMDDAVWLTYGPAQALIVFSVGAAIALAGGR